MSEWWQLRVTQKGVTTNVTGDNGVLRTAYDELKPYNSLECTGRRLHRED